MPNVSARAIHSTTRKLIFGLCLRLPTIRVALVGNRILWLDDLLATQKVWTHFALYG